MDSLCSGRWCSTGNFGSCYYWYLLACISLFITNTSFGDGWEELTKQRANLGLRPLIKDPFLMRCAKAKAIYIAKHHISLQNGYNGHEGPTMGPGYVEGCGVGGPEWGWISCAMRTIGRYPAGAAVVLGDDGNRYMCLLIRGTNLRETQRQVPVIDTSHLSKPPKISYEGPVPRNYNEPGRLPQYADEILPPPEPIFVKPLKGDEMDRRNFLFLSLAGASSAVADNPFLLDDAGDTPSFLPLKKRHSEIEFFTGPNCPWCVKWEREELWKYKSVGYDVQKKKGAPGKAIPYFHVWLDGKKLVHRGFMTVQDFNKLIGADNQANSEPKEVNIARPEVGNPLGTQPPNLSYYRARWTWPGSLERHLQGPPHNMDTGSWNYAQMKWMHDKHHDLIGPAHNSREVPERTASQPTIAQRPPTRISGRNNRVWVPGRVGGISRPGRNM